MVCNFVKRIGSQSLVDEPGKPHGFGAPFFDVHANGHDQILALHGS